MTCKCDKDKFKEEFINEINDRYNENMEEYQISEDRDYREYSYGLEDAKRIFLRLWKEHMEEDDA